MITSDALRRLMAILALVSGMASVVYEVLYMRILTTHLGDMYYIHVAIVGVFLLGIGVGAKASGLFVEKLYLVELVIGAYAMVFPEIVTAYVSLIGVSDLGPALSTTVSVVLLLALPSFAIGCSVPLFSEYLSRLAANSGAFQRVYMLYNLGASINILVADLLLIRWIGIGPSTRLVGVLNISCGVALWLLRSQLASGTTPPVRAGRRIAVPLEVSVFLASLAAAVFQGYFLKTYYNIFGPERENFALCTASLLGGIALATHLVRARGIDYSTCLLSALKVLSLTALCSAGVGYYSQIEFEATIAVPSIAWKLVVAGFLGAWPYAWLAGTIPALVRDDEDVARTSGHLLFISGIANVSGLFLYVFVIHPHLDFFAAPLVAGVLLFFALLIADHGFTIVGKLPWVLASAVGLFLVATRVEDVAFLGFTPYPRGIVVTTFKSASDTMSHIQAGSSSSVRYNGHTSISVRADGVVNTAEIVSGVIPALVSRERGDALVLGLGTGITGGATAQLFDHTDIAEISGASIDLARNIPYANFDVAHNPRATISYADGRQFLRRAKPGMYDVVVNSIPSPIYYAGGKIYTREFFRMAKRSLKPNGVYCTWMSPAEMTPQGLESLIATLASTFKHCNLATLRGSYYFASCSDDRLTPVSFESIAPPETVVRTLKAGIPYAPLETYFRSIFLSSDILGGVRGRRIELNTDDFPILEYRLAQRASRPNFVIDPIAEQPQRYNVDIARMAPDPAEWLDRAVVLYHVHNYAYDRFFRRELEADPSLLKMFNARVAGST